MIKLISLLSVLFLQAQSGGNAGAFAFLLLLILLAISIGLFVLVYKLAAKRERSTLGWILFSLFFSPVLAIILLLILGDSSAKIANETASKMIDELRSDREQNE